MGERSGDEVLRDLAWKQGFPWCVSGRWNKQVWSEGLEGWEVVCR